MQVLRWYIAKRTPWGALAVCLSAIILGAQVILAAHEPAADRFADLQVYQGAVDAWLHHGSLYSFMRHNGDTFTYPPAAAYSLAWLRLVPLTLSYVIWAILEFAALVSIAWAFGSRRSVEETGLPLLGTKTTRVTAFAILLLLLVLTAPTRSNIEFGQLSVLVIAATVLDLLLVRETRSGWLLGLAIAIKFIPLLFVPMLWLSGRRGAALRAMIAALGLTLIAYLGNPADSFRYLRAVLPRESRIVDVWIPANQSLRAMLERLRVPHPSFWWLILSVFAAGWALNIAVRFARSNQWVAATVIVGAATVLVSPISWTHHQFWLVLAVLLPVSRRRGIGRCWQLLVILVMSLPVISLHVSSSLPVELLGWILSNTRLLLAVSCLVLGARRVL